MRRSWIRAARGGVVLAATMVGVASADLTVGAWETRAPAPSRAQHSIGFLHGGRVIVLDSPDATAGHVPMRAYLPATDSWTTTSPAGGAYPSMPASPRAGEAAALLGGGIYVAGGWVGSDCHNPTYNFARYDLATNAWATLGSLPGPHRALTACGAIGTRLVIAGGYDGNCHPPAASGIVQVYDTATATWSTGASMPTAVQSAAAAVVGGRLYVIGGQTTSGSTVGLVQSYDPADGPGGTWASHTAMPTPRMECRAAVIDDRWVVVVGGHSSAGLLSTVEAYDTATDTWCPLPSLPTVRYNVACVAIPSPSAVHVIGGIDSTLGYGTERNDRLPVATDVNAAPVAEIGGPDEVVIECSSHEGETVVLDGSGSTDEDGDDLTFAWTGPFGTSEGPSLETVLGLGTHEITLTVSDGEFEDSATVTVTVRDTTDPTIECPGDVEAVAADEDGAVVTFAPPAAADACDPAPEVVCDPPSGSTLPVGTTEVVCTATDASGNAAECRFTVTVAPPPDTTPPTISAATPSVEELWPVNGRMRSVTFTVVATDDRGGPVECEIVDVECDEEAEGDTAITGVLSADLRAERDGKGDGRVYTVRIVCRDEAGNAAETTVEVVVPHDQGKDD